MLLGCLGKVSHDELSLKIDLDVFPNEIIPGLENDLPFLGAFAEFGENFGACPEGMFRLKPEIDLTSPASWGSADSDDRIKEGMFRRGEGRCCKHSALVMRLRVVEGDKVRQGRLPDFLRCARGGVRLVVALCCGDTVFRHTISTEQFTYKHFSLNKIYIVFIQLYSSQDFSHDIPYHM